MIDQEKFERVRQKVIGESRERNGIGTLKEKSIHAVLKNYYEENEDKQEIPIDGFVADIYNGNEIIEIQTAHFNKMREKLNTFLPGFKVLIVHPVAKANYIIWIDQTTGEYLPKRKSPIIGNPYFIFPELYKIKDYLLNPNLSIKIALLETEELKLLSSKRGRKRGQKFDKLPVGFVEEITIEQVEDYIQFIPIELEDEFISGDFAKAAHISIDLARITLNILRYVGVIEKIGKKGNNIIYKITG